MVLIVGSLTYRQRIALRPGGVAIVALSPRSVTGEMLESDVRQWRFDLHDRQVPIQFELEVPIDIATDSANVELSAWIDDAEGVRCFSTSSPVLVEFVEEPVDVGTVVLKMDGPVH